MSEYVWLSVDPVRRKVDFYPKSIAKKIEEEYIKSRNMFPNTCVLGEDFFNATIHFYSMDIFYQTTPGMSFGRAGFKQPGYRSVMRYPIINNNEKLIIYAKQIHSEWRICNETDYEIKFVENVPIDNIVNSEDLQSKYLINYWNPDDLNLEDNYKEVIIWEWCRQTHGNILTLNNKYWVPYLFEHNKYIETNFKNNKSIIIKINNNEERKIELSFNSCYGFQKSLDNTKVRNIRRRVIYVSELKRIMENIFTIPNDIQFLENIIDFDEIPHEFICCISQEIMVDPVKTYDYHIYDRASIEKWFLNSNKSPLTGLELETKDLIPVHELKNKIQEFTRLKFESYNKNLHLVNNHSISVKKDDESDDELDDEF